MDKKDKSDDHFKDSMRPGANPFLNAASLLGAYWGNNSRDNISPLQLYGMGMIPPGYGAALGKSSTSSAAQSAAAAAANLNSDWYAMAQMAAQDYLTRIQMNAMMGATDPSQSPLTNSFSDSLSSLVNSLSNNSSSSSKSNNNKKNETSNISDQNYDSKSRQKQQQQQMLNSKTSSNTSIMPNRKDNSNSTNLSQNYSSKRKSTSSPIPSYNKKDFNDHKNSNNSNLSPLIGVRLPPDTEIIKYTSNNQSSSNDTRKDESSSKKQKLEMNNSRKSEIKENTNGLESDWMTETLDLSRKSSSSANRESVDSPLNLSVKSTKESSKNDEMATNNGRSNSSPSPSTSNNLNSLQTLTAGIGTWNKDSKSQSSRDGRPRNLGRGIQTSRPKKNTVASLLAQSRATGVKSHLSPSDSRYSNLDKNSISSDNQSNTDSESHNDTSEVSESEGESENMSLECLRKPLAQGWKRETIIRGLTRSGHLKGDVHYFAPSSDSVKLKNMAQIKMEIAATGSNLKEENFSFTARKVIGTYLQAAPAPYATEGEFVRLTEQEVTQRLEEIRLYTRQSSTQLNVEQRIEIARQQQMLREAKKNYKDDICKSKEKQKISKEIEKNEKLEMLRREKELKALQIQEAKRKRDEETARLRLEEQRRRQEDKERKKQHLVIMKMLDSRGKYEEREKKRHQLMLEKLVAREQTLSVRKFESKILSELRKPREDSEIGNKVELPKFSRINGQKLTSQGFADLLMSFEFLHNFGETLGFDMGSLPLLESLHDALAEENALESEEELLSVITHLLVCAIEDPGIPNPNRHLTLLGQTLRQADITNQSVSEVLRIYLYAVATGEIRQQNGVYYEKEKCGKFGDLHQNDNEERQANIVNGKNAHFYEVLHENERYKLSEALKDKPYVALSSTMKAQIFAMLCNDLLLNKAVCKQIENGLESQATLRREKFVLENKVRKYQGLVAKKQRIEQYEKSQQILKKENAEDENSETTTDTPKESSEKTANESTNEISRIGEKIDDDNSESDGTEMDEDEDNNMTSEEVQKKLDKIMEQSSQTKLQLQKALNSLRAKHYGQDRMWRRYWNLPKVGGIYVESLESAQKDLMRFQEKLEIVVTKQEQMDVEKSEVVNGEKEEKMKKEENVTNGITTKSEEIDIEESIPSAILVQKESETDDTKFVEINHVMPSTKTTMPMTVEVKEEQNGEIKNEKMEIDEQKVVDVKDEPPTAMSMMKVEDDNKILSKWFSLIDREVPLYITDCPIFENKLEKWREVECHEECIMQGHQWEIHNNLQFYDVRNKLNENQEIVEFKNESVLSTSGLKDDSIRKFMIDGILERRSDDESEDSKNNVVKIKQNLDVESQNQCDINHSFTLPSIKNLTIHNLSVILQCENLNSNNYSPEEQEALEDFKRNGIKKSFTKSFVKRDDRHGWWKINDREELNQLVKSLHTKGLRERNLRQNMLTACAENIDLSTPCPISTETDENGENDEEKVEFANPDEVKDWNPKIAKRVEQQLLDNIEALEDKVANASMQIKGWAVPQREQEADGDETPSDNVEVDEIRNRILNLESAIERRYLKPPLGNNTAEAQLMNAAAQNDLNSSNTSNGSSNILDFDNIPKALSTWRDAVKRSVTSSQLSMALYFLEQCVAWDKSIMKANCQFCQSGESEDKLLLCDSCDRGYHTYCFKPKMEKIPEGDWFCYECLNKATGEKKCIICGGNRPNPGKLIFCELCPRCYHHDCYIPPMLKIPRGKWYCSNCASKAPPKKKPARKQKELKAHNSSQSLDSSQEDHPMVCPSPSLSSFSMEEQNPSKKANENSFQMPISAAAAAVVKINNENCIEDEETEIKQNDTDNNAAKEITNKNELKEKDEQKEKAKADKKATKKIIKEMSICKIILEEMEVHEDSWPFLLPVNTKQFPTYRKIIKHPMDLSTIKKNLQDIIYKSRDEFVGDVRQIFDNCEVFNEDDSPVGKAGHEMRKYFELRWVELTEHNS